MDKSFNSSSLRLACELPGRFHMHGFESLCSAFAIEADSVHHTIRARDSLSNRVFVLNIGAYPLALGMP
jgi:hypothetical protein